MSDQHAQISQLQEQLANERQQHSETRAQLQASELKQAIVNEAGNQNARHPIDIYHLLDFRQLLPDMVDEKGEPDNEKVLLTIKAFKIDAGYAHFR